MKLYMHWDMEGTSGLFKREQTWFWEKGVRQEVAEEGQALLMADINSAVAAALQAGAGEVLVCDTHGGGGNIHIAKMLRDPRVTYHVKPRERNGTLIRWMPGLDETVDGLLLMGHHAKAGTEGAFLPHTWMGDWADFRINGESVGELGIEACYASHWNIPFILVHGEEAACREAEKQYPWLVTAAVKRAVDHDLCTGPDAESARRLTAQKVAEAVSKVSTGCFRPYKPKLPMTVTIRMKTIEKAQAAADKPSVKRLDDYTVEYRVERHCDVVKWICNAGIDVVETR